MRCAFGDDARLRGRSFRHLTVTNSPGAFSLPARMETREGEVDGTPMKATGILANGPVSSIMPDKAAIESCVKSKLSGDLLEDSTSFSRRP